jgi:hypothetical protein
MFEDGSLSLTYASADAPHALYGVFVVPGVCGSKASCGKSMYHLSQLGGESGTISRINLWVRSSFHAGGNSSTNQGGAEASTVQYWSLITPWGAFFSPLAIYFSFGLMVVIVGCLKFAGKTQ